MSRQVNFDVTLRDQLVAVRATLRPPDKDVGIMGWQIDDYILLGQDNEELDWELTDDEVDELCDAMPDPEDNQPDYPEED